VKWQFLAENPTFQQAWSIRYLRTKHAVRFQLRNRTTAQTEYVMGCTVKNLLKLWVCKLSFFKRGPIIIGYLGHVFFENICIMCVFPKREFICLKFHQIFNWLNLMILIEVGSSIPYLGFHSELSSSLKRLISEAGWYNKLPKIPFTVISARYFNILLFWIDGCVS
jgi:hypothetical protein